jgi:hypothetical protein
MRFYFPFDLGNTGNKREHLVTITGNSSQTFHRILPLGRDLESWWKSFVLAIFSPSKRIRFSFRRKSPPSRRTQEGLVFQAATLTEYPNAFSAEALRFQEGQQVGVNGIGLGRGHAVRKALVGFQCAIL